MTSFRTGLEIERSVWSISHKDGMITLGSCFSEEIGNRLGVHKFKVMANPFGTVYNPLSLCRLIDWTLEGSTPTEGYSEYMGIHSNLHFHSSFNAINEAAVRNSIESKMKEVSEFLPSSKYLLLTLGTAWVYRHRGSNEIVSNCQKRPASEFSREMLSTKEILANMEKTLERVWEAYPEMRIILTVSPVRHTRDGLENNAVSKSTMRLAAHHLANDHDRVEYFPSYEIVLDDLRDYRFYESDMIHPNSTAVDYIWEKWSSRYFSEETIDLNLQIIKLVKCLQHKPFIEDSEAHIRFLEKTISKLNLLNEKVNLQEEIDYCENQLKKLKK